MRQRQREGTKRVDRVESTARRRTDRAGRLNADALLATRPQICDWKYVGRMTS